MKSPVFNALLMLAAVAGGYLPIRALPARAPSPPASVELHYDPVELPAAAGPLRLAGAWELTVSDPRFGGISSLTIDRGRFLAVSDRGSVARFDPPAKPYPRAWVADLREGPGPWGRKWARDAESLAADPDGRGWWVGYEQHHSVWLYDRAFARALAAIDLDRVQWWNNRGAEGLLSDGRLLLAVGENGRDAVLIRGSRTERMALVAPADIAEAVSAPNGSAWLLLRAKSYRGITQSVAQMIRTEKGYRAGAALPLPKNAFDNFEGMAIQSRADGGLRFWLITDDGHRIMARTLLVALDYVPARQDQSSAAGAGSSGKPLNETP